MKKCLTIAAALLGLLTGCQDKPDGTALLRLQTPYGVVLHSSTETTLTFQWSLISEATSYSWRLTEVGNGSEKTGSTPNRNVRIDRLKKATEYSFCVRAESKDAVSGWSQEVTATTQGSVVPPTPDIRTVCIDEPLLLTFESAPVLGSSGCVKLFRADGVEVDCIDLADMAGVTVRGDGQMVPKEQMNAQTKFSTFMDALPSGKRWRPVHYTPLRIDGKSLEIRFHSGVMDFGTEYYVTMDKDFVSGFPGYFRGDMPFVTRPKPEGSVLSVAPYGDGDFWTVQAALSYAGTISGPVTIKVAPGTYREMLYLRDKADLTIEGTSREKCIIEYANAEALSTGSGGAAGSRPSAGSAVGAMGGRGLMLVENCNNLQLKGLTIRNSYGEQGQAETIYFNSGSNAHRLIIEDCALYSLQDTFLCKGEVYVHNSLIAGNVDFIWGYPKVCLFEDCEIRCEYHKNGGYVIQARVPSAGDKGFVFLNCRITAGEGAKDGSVYLARSAGQADCFDNVTYVGCTMAPVIAPAGWYSSPAPNPSAPTASSGWKEYGSVTPAGASATGSRNKSGLILSADQAAAYSSRAEVLGW